MANQERAARLESAVREIQHSIGFQPLVRPSATLQPPGNFANGQRTKPMRPRSISFEDLRLSVGASTLAWHLQNPDDSRTPTGPLTRSSSVDSLADLHGSSKRSVNLRRNTGIKPTALSRHPHDIASDTSSIGGWSTFSVQSQVPAPLAIIPSKGQPKPIQTQQSMPDTNSVLAQDSPKDTLTEFRTKQRPRWRPVLSPQPSASNFEESQDIIPPHPAVRVPPRAATPRQAHPPGNLSSQKENSSNEKPDPRNRAPIVDTANVNSLPARREIGLSNHNEIAENGGAASPSVNIHFPLIQALAGFLIFFNVWGSILSYGALQAYFATEKFNGISPTALALIGSLQPFSLYVFAPASAAFVSGWKFRACLHGGSALLLVATFCTPLCSTYWQLFLTQGLAASAGMSLIFKTTMESLAFSTPNRRYATTLALAAAGSTFGAITHILVIRTIVSPVAFSRAMHAIGFTALGTLLPANAALRPLPALQHSLGPRSRTQTSWRAAFTVPRHAPFRLAAFGVFLASLGVLVPFFSVVSFAIAVLHLSGPEACIPLLAMVTATVPGFVGPLLLMGYRDRGGDRGGSSRSNGNRSSSDGNRTKTSRTEKSALDVRAACTFVAALVVFLRIGTDTQAGTLALAVLYGLAAAALSGLDLPLVARLVRAGGSSGGAGDAEDTGGGDAAAARAKDVLVCAAAATGFLAGPPIGTALAMGSHGGTGYVYAQVFAGMVLFVGGCCFLGARWIVTRG